MQVLIKHELEHVSAPGRDMAALVQMAERPCEHGLDLSCEEERTRSAQSALHQWLKTQLKMSLGQNQRMPLE